METTLNDAQRPNNTAVRIAAVLAGLLFGAGYMLLAIIPSGGDNVEQEFLDYYQSNGQRSLAFVLVLALIVGCLVLMWLFTELREHLGATALTRVASTLGVQGATLALAGGAIAFGPTAVQLTSNSDFVGVNIAHAIAQSALGVILTGGMSALAAAVFLLSLAARRTSTLATWASTTGLVVGVIMIGSMVWIPGFVFPVWLIAVGIAGFRSR